MDWGSLVAATAVGGLIVLAVDGGARWYLRRRERRAKQAEAEYDRRTYIRVGGHIVATELRTNADVAKRFEAGNRAPSEGKAVSLTAWRERKSEIMGLRD